MKLFGVNAHVAVTKFEKDFMSKIKLWSQSPPTDAPRSVRMEIDLGLTALRVLSLSVRFIHAVLNGFNRDKLMSFSPTEPFSKLLNNIKQNRGDNTWKDIVYALCDVTQGHDIIGFRNIKFPCGNIPQDYWSVVLDTFCLYLANKPYTRINVDFADTFCNEGSYFIDDMKYSMTLKKGDIVFDIGSWYGDFAALASVEFGAVVYAFEPDDKNYEALEKTINLNADKSSKIIPVKMGVGAAKSEAFIKTDAENMGTAARISESAGQACIITTIDDFVRENNISQVDFIKADIEGFEREMLKGAVNTKKLFAWVE